MSDKKTTVILSGGMDSTTLLYKLVKDGHECVALSFHYGQKHGCELGYAKRTADKLLVRHKVVDIGPVFDGLQIESALLNVDTPVPEGHYEDETMKATVVPNRNMVLVAIATSFAISNGHRFVAYGAHFGDHAIYPDCRNAFIDALDEAIKLCDWQPPLLLTPFSSIMKHDIAKIGAELGVPYEDTWSCYKGGERHCGKCGTCVERQEAFALAGLPDPTVYEE